MADDRGASGIRLGNTAHGQPIMVTGSLHGMVCLERKEMQTGGHLEHLSHPLDSIHQAIHLLTGVIEGEAGASCAQDAQAIHQGLGAMVSRTDSYAQPVEQRSHIHVMDVPHLEADDGIVLSTHRAINMHALYLGHPLKRILGKVTLVSLYIVHAQGGDIVQSLSQA